MKAFFRTIGGSILLGLIAFVIAAGVNAARGEGNLSWTKAYFAKKDVTPPPPNVQADKNENRESDPAPSDPDPKVSARSAVIETTEDVSVEVDEADEVNAQPELAFGYQSISTDEVADIVSDPNYDRYRYVLIDARSRSAYEAGHIQGSIRCYHYELDTCLDNVLAYALGAEKVIVYCNGGDCEDSKFMCQELIDQGVSWSTIYLYADGWQDWVGQDMPYVEGAE